MGESDTESSDGVQEEDPTAKDQPTGLKEDISSSEEVVNTEKELKQFEVLHCPQSVVTEKKMVIEIKGKTALGKDAVFALNREFEKRKRQSNELSSKNITTMDGLDEATSKVKRRGMLINDGESQGSLQSTEQKQELDKELESEDMHSPNTMHVYPYYRESLFDTRKSLPTAKSNHNLEHREKMLDLKERMRERRARYTAHLDRNLSPRDNLWTMFQCQEPSGHERRMMNGTKDEGTLKISDRSLCDNGCEALLRVVRNNDKLTELDLSGCNIYKGDELADIVRSAKSLKRLLLQWNNLGLARTGIVALSSAIAANTSLKEVDLRSNQIGPSTVAALAHALYNNFSLTCLDLRWNQIGPSGAAAIFSMLQKNHALIDVRLAGNGIPPSVQTQIEELLDKNRESKNAIFSISHEDAIPQSCAHSSKATNKDMEKIHIERIKSLQEKINVLRKEMETSKAQSYDIQLQNKATNTQLETMGVELKEESLMRKFVEKEASEMILELNKYKQKVLDFEEKMASNEKLGTMKLSILHMELVEAKEKLRKVQVVEAEIAKENKYLTEQVIRIQSDCKSRIEAAEERAKSNMDYSTSIIRRLETELAHKDHVHKKEMESSCSKLTMQLKAIESAKETSTREIEQHKSVALHCDAQMAAKEQIFQNEKEATQKVFDGKISTYKVAVATLQSQLEAQTKEIHKTKKKLAANTEEYEDQIAQLTTSITKLELAKVGIEEKMQLMTVEERKVQERMKVSDNKVREMETKIHKNKLNHSEDLAHELTKHLEDRKKLEDELMATRRQIDIVHLHVKEIQSEQERRKFDTEKRVMGAETAVSEWIHQQFATLKSALTNQHSVVGIG